MVKLIKIKENGGTHLEFDKPGDYIVLIKNISGNFKFDILSENVSLDIYGIYTGHKNEKYAVETLQRHAKPNSVSNLFIKGVFDDESVLDYRGLIRIEKDAQQSHAYQKNQNIILSPKATVESKPYLEILANDVFCTHGSTTGKINTEQVNYLQTRGIEINNARKLLVQGFIDEIYDLINKKVPNFDRNT